MRQIEEDYVALVLPQGFVIITNMKESEIAWLIYGCPFSNIFCATLLKSAQDRYYYTSLAKSYDEKI